jgi:LCP family protein required for cell wall assembly
MSGMSADDDFRGQAPDERGTESASRGSRGPVRRRLRHAALAAGACLALVIGLAAGGAYLTARHLAGSVQRLPGIAALDAADQPLMPAATRASMTILLTSSGQRPGPNGGGTDGASPDLTALSDLIALVHLDANDSGGAVVSIPANTAVSIPGHGTGALWSALRLGGPSLLIQTVEHLTNVRIGHYAVLDFPSARDVFGAMNGVQVDVPVTVHSEGLTFPAGIDHLAGASVLAYAEQPGVSEAGRAELQSNLIRAMVNKVATEHLLGHVSLDYRLLDAIAHAFSVDGNLSDSHLMVLALRLGGLSGGDGVFITAPTTTGSAAGGAGRLRQPYARLLWSAIRHDAVAAYARKYPLAVTPGAPR